MVDVISLAVGFIIGVIILGLALEIGTKKTNRSTPASKHTNKWSISEISNPRIIAEYMGDVKLPADSKVLVNKYKDKQMFAGISTKEHGGIRGNYIIGDDRALILSGPIKNNELGIWTVEKEIVEALKQEFDMRWNEADTMEFEEQK